MNLFEAMAIFVRTEEGEDDEPEHIERRKSCNKESDNRYEVMPRQFPVGKGACKDRVFTQEPRCERHAADRERIHKKSVERDRHLLLEPPHIANVLRVGVMIVRMVKGMMHRVDDRT